MTIQQRRHHIGAAPTGACYENKLIHCLIIRLLQGVLGIKACQFHHAFEIRVALRQFFKCPAIDNFSTI